MPSTVAILLVDPLGIDMIQPFLIFTDLMINSAVVVIPVTDKADLSRTKRKQTSEDVPAVPSPVPGGVTSVTSGPTPAT